MIQFRRVKEIGGSVDISETVRLNFEHLRSKKTTLHHFIHELIHIVQFAEGYNMYNDSTDDEQLMLEDAETYLFNTKIPELWRSLI